MRNSLIKKRYLRCVGIIFLSCWMTNSYSIAILGQCPQTLQNIFPEVPEIGLSYVNSYSEKNSFSLEAQRNDENWFDMLPKRRYPDPSFNSYTYQAMYGENGELVVTRRQNSSEGPQHFEDTFTFNTHLGDCELVNASFGASQESEAPQLPVNINRQTCSEIQTPENLAMVRDFFEENRQLLSDEQREAYRNQLFRDEFDRINESPARPIVGLSANEQSSLFMSRSEYEALASRADVNCQHLQPNDLLTLGYPPLGPGFWYQENQRRDARDPEGGRERRNALLENAPSPLVQYWLPEMRRRHQVAVQEALDNGEQPPAEPDDEILAAYHLYKAEFPVCDEAKAVANTEFSARTNVALLGRQGLDFARGRRSYGRRDLFRPSQSYEEYKELVIENSSRGALGQIATHGVRKVSELCNSLSSYFVDDIVPAIASAEVDDSTVQGDRGEPASSGGGFSEGSSVEGQ